MSWKADSQLVRTHDDGSYNLAIGEPFFLQEVFAPYYPTLAPDRMGYPKSEPEPELRQELEKLHPGRYVVVTVGAKQALHAAVHALQMKSGGGWPGIYHRSPCWPTYGSVADLAALSFTNDDGGINIRINTSPNNPDGSSSSEPCEIWDAAYATETYGWNGRPPPHQISVWSAAKMLGCSGIRVGWLVTDDPELARHASAYVEMTTSGVAVSSQLFVARVLKDTHETRSLLFSKANGYLRNNCRLLNGIRSHFRVLDGFPEHGSGMFAWFRVQNDAKFQEALKKARVRVLPGWACKKDEPGWYRVSLGHHYAVTQQAIITLKQALETE